MAFKSTGPDGGDIDDIFATQADIDPFLGRELWTWGFNNSGELGDGTVVKKSSPVQTVAGGNDWKQITSGGASSGAIKTDGTLWMWGINTNGQLGDNTIINRSSPVQTITGGTDWKQIIHNGTFMTAIKTDGTLWLSGSNSLGQLGDGTVVKKSSPVQTVAGGNDWKQVSAGNDFVSAIKTDGTLWTWGNDSYGQLGENTATTLDRSSPVQTVTGGNDWAEVSCGNFTVNAIKNDGTLWTWGYNFAGEIGDDTTVNRSSPVQTITGGNDWNKIKCGNSVSAAIKNDGTLWLWGYNATGQLGDGTILRRSSPVQTIAGGNNWKQIRDSNGHMGAIKTDGTLWMWGGNTNGNLGNNLVANTSSPVQTITGGNDWFEIAGGGNHTSAIKIKG